MHTCNNHGISKKYFVPFCFLIDSSSISTLYLLNFQLSMSFILLTWLTCFYSEQNDISFFFSGKIIKRPRNRQLPFFGNIIIMLLCMQKLHGWMVIIAHVLIKTKYSLNQFFNNFSFKNKPKKLFLLFLKKTNPWHYTSTC